MPRLALALAIGALLAVVASAPGPFLAIGLAIAALGTGWVGFARRGAPGTSRLLAAGAITLGSIGLVLGALRVVLVLAAIDHIEGMFGPITS